MCEPPVFGPPGGLAGWGAEIVCMRYWPLVWPGGFVSLALLVKVQSSVKNPEPWNVNHDSIVALPLAGRMLAGSERYPLVFGVLPPVKLGLFN